MYIARRKRKICICDGIENKNAKVEKENNSNCPKSYIVRNYISQEEKEKCVYE